MARIVLGLGTSHGPTMRTPPEQWGALGQKDAEDPRLDYEALRRGVGSHVAAELTPDKWRARYDACQAGARTLAGLLDRVDPDVIVLITNPHRVWPHDYQPVFGIYRGPTVPVVERRPRRPASRLPESLRPGSPRVAQAAVEADEHPACPELADHLIECLIAEGVDVACARQLRPEIGLEDAFAILFETYLPRDRAIPVLPLMVSRYLPSQATPARCYAVGRALRRAIESWEGDRRVAIMASGGLSHQVVDEELDRTLLAALAAKDADRLCSLPRDRLNRAPGTPEILNWVALAGAMEPVAMTLVDYLPCYRSPAGTGHGVAFAHWTE